MADVIDLILTIPQLKKKYLAVYLKGCKTPALFAVTDTEATYKKIKKSLEEKPTCVLEKICIDERGKKISIPLNGIIAVAIQDLSCDLSFLEQ